MAQEFTYECVGPCTYKIYNRVYRDCSGASILNLNVVDFTPVSGTNCGTPVLDPNNPWLSSELISEVTPICPAIPTNCTQSSSIVRGVEEYLNYAIYDFCGTSCAFNLTWNICCRNYAITSGAGGNAHITGPTVIDPRLTICNNSPTFTSPPIFYICNGDTTTVSQGCYDQENDSLVYHLAPCWDSVNVPVTYSAGYSPTEPLGPNWEVALDSTNGNVSFLPTPGSLEVGVFCIEIEEWRNGQLIGKLWRDIQVATSNCGTNANPVFDSLVVVSNGTANGGTISGVTLGQQLCFDLYTSDPDISQQLTVYWDSNIPGGTFFDPNNVTITDTIIGTNPVARFCLTPTVPGRHRMLATVVDDYCPFAGFEDMLIDIEVIGTGLNAWVSKATCRDFYFVANPMGGAGPYTYSWSGSGGLSSTTQVFTHYYPGPGTFPWALTVTDPSGFNHTTSGSVSVDTVDSATWLTFPRAISCPPDSVDLEGTRAPGGSYLWSTGNTTDSILKVGVGGDYWLHYTDPNGCTIQDTVNIPFSPNKTFRGWAWDPNLVGLNQQKVYLIYFNLLDSSLTAVDSMLTDQFGYFHFDCETQYSTYYIKAAPDSATYPTVMPTYWDSSLVFQAATPYPRNTQPLAQIYCQAGINPGGPGFIGGLISQGANKQSDPVVNLRLFLIASNGDAIGYTDTDANGYFSFANLPQDTFWIKVDKPYIWNSQGPRIAIGPGQLVRDSLPFLLHSNYLELQDLTTRSLEVSDFPVVSVSPNPFTDEVRVKLHLDQSEEIRLTISDLQGRIIEKIAIGNVPAGDHQFEFDQLGSLPAGLFVLTAETRSGRNVSKLVKMSGD